MQFNLRLKNLRQLHRMTQNELADILGVKPSTIANYESNRNEPSFEKLITIASFFHVSVDYLLGRTEECHNCIFKNFEKDKLEIIHTFSKLDTSNIERIGEYMDYLIYKQTK